MKKQIFVIFDTAAQVYNTPFFMLNEATAVRAGKSLLDDPTSDIARSPSDFAMFHVGEYDDETAKLTPSEKQKCVLKFHEIKSE